MVRLLITRSGVSISWLVLAGCLGWATGLLPGRAQAAAPAAAETSEALELRIKADAKQCTALFQRAELEAVAQLIATNVANPQFSPAERKAYALGIETWLQAHLYNTYLTLKQQQKPGEPFPVARLQRLFEQYDGVYQVLVELASGELAVLKRQLNKEELYLISYQAVQATNLAAQAQARLVQIGRAVLAHPQAQWNEYPLVLQAFNYPELIPLSTELLRTLMGQAARLGVHSAADWSSLGRQIEIRTQTHCNQDLFRAAALDCFETALALAATNTVEAFAFQRDTAEQLTQLLSRDVKERIWATNAVPPEAFTQDLKRVLAALAALQRAYPENSSQAQTFGRLRQELNYSLAVDIVRELHYVRLTRSQMGDVIGCLLRFKSGAPSDQAAKFDALVADAQMRRVQGLTKRTEASVLADVEAETRYKLACADAPKDQLNYYESLYKSYLAQAEKLKAREAEKRRERARQQPAANEWRPVFQDPRLIDKPAVTTAAPSSSGNQSGAAAPAQSTGRYCMSCSGTGTRTVWEDAYDSYSRKWGRQQVRKSCDRCGGKGTLP